MLFVDISDVLGAQVIYIDQPIGTGFSFGTDTVNSTLSASPFVWQAFQVLFESGEFGKFQSREYVQFLLTLFFWFFDRLILATESYGGHYGPALVTYFNQQNQLIKEGKLKGEEVVVSALMINKYILPLSHAHSWLKYTSGWFDPLIQNQAYVDFATNAPGYGQLQSDQVIQRLNEAFFGPGGCQEQEIACSNAGDSVASNSICRRADDFCVIYVELSVDVLLIPVFFPLSRSKTSLSPQLATAMTKTCDRIHLLYSRLNFTSTISEIPWSREW